MGSEEGPLNLLESTDGAHRKNQSGELPRGLIHEILEIDLPEAVD